MNKIGIGTRLQLGGKDNYIVELTDFYYAIEENSGRYQEFVEYKEIATNKIDKMVTSDILWMLQTGGLWVEGSKFGEEYYEKVRKPQLEKFNDG